MITVVHSRGVENAMVANDLQVSNTAARYKMLHLIMISVRISAGRSETEVILRPSVGLDLITFLPIGTSKELRARYLAVA